MAVVLPAGPYQRADAGAEAAGDPEPAPAAATDAATAAAGAAAHADDARTGLEHDPQHGGCWWHSSNHEQSTDPASERTAVSVSSKLRYWFHPPLQCVLAILTPQYPPLCLGPIPSPTAPCLPPWEQWETWSFRPIGNVVPSTFLALVWRIL